VLGIEQLEDRDVALGDGERPVVGIGAVEAPARASWLLVHARQMDERHGLVTVRDIQMLAGTRSREMRCAMVNCA
jgi:hypothetical protein